MKQKPEPIENLLYKIKSLLQAFFIIVHVLLFIGNFEWPPRSPDLITLDSFLGGCLKLLLVYANRSRTLHAFKDKITQEIETIRV